MVASNPRWQGKQPVLLVQMTQKTFLNESSGMTHAGSHIWQIWVTSLMVLSVLRVPGNIVPRVKCTSCSNRLHSHASLRHSDGHKQWGWLWLPVPEAELATPQEATSSHFPMSLRSHHGSKIPCLEVSRAGLYSLALYANSSCISGANQSGKQGKHTKKPEPFIFLEWTQRRRKISMHFESISNKKYRLK